MDWYMISVIAFFAILALIIHRDRKNIQVDSHIIFLRRTKRFGDIIDRVAQISPKFWRLVGTFGIIVCGYLMLDGLKMLFDVSQFVAGGYMKEPALQLILPIPGMQLSVGPGFIGIPFWFWIITIGFILIPHEFFHGIMARADKIRLKSVGLLLMAVFPGAFVEPDEKQMKKAKLLTKVRIFAAGSFMNIMIAIIIAMLANSFLWEPNVHPGIMINELNQTAPAALAGMQPGMIIEKIDGQPLNLTYADYSFIMLKTPDSINENITKTAAAYLLGYHIYQHSPGDNITVTADGKDYMITLDPHPQALSVAYLGIDTYNLNTDRADLFSSWFPLLAFIWVLSMGVAIVNILPLFPLDGGLILKAVADKYFKKNAADIVTVISWFVISMVLFDIFGPILMNL